MFVVTSVEFNYLLMFGQNSYRISVARGSTLNTTIHYIDTIISI